MDIANLFGRGNGFCNNFGRIYLAATTRSPGYLVSTSDFKTFPSNKFVLHDYSH